jgi:3'-5' exonuclease
VRFNIKCWLKKAVMSEHVSLTDLLVIDIETVPGVSLYQELTDEWKGLWNAKISKTVPENFNADDLYQERAGIMAEFGKIICISAGFFYPQTGDEYAFKVKSVAGDAEQKVLLDFFEMAEKFYKKKPNFSFAGHNIREFDIPFICRRSLVNGVNIPPFLQFSGKKPWEVNMVDTLQYWKFGDFKNYTSLSLLSAVLGVPTPKDDIDGSMVRHVYYEEKNLTRIVEYCQKDVVAVANVILRFRNLSLLKPENILVAE